MKKRATTAVLFHGIETVSVLLVVFYVDHSGQYGFLFIWPSFIRQLFESLLFSQRCYKYALEAHTHSKTDIISRITRDLIAFPLRGLPSPNLPEKGGNDEGDDNAHNQEEHPPPIFPEYTDERTRLLSFRNWPLQQPTKEFVSAAGFFYTGRDNFVQCFQCGIGFPDFNQNVDPLHMHTLHNPNCHFLRKLFGGNVSNTRLVLSEFMALYKHLQKQKNDIKISEKTREKQARHPKYQNIRDRLNSFTEWPISGMVRPEDLAGAGLFYTGYQDCVRCYACGGGMKDWKQGDDPWIEHCRFYPQCPYVNDAKSAEYIAQVQIQTSNQRDADFQGVPYNNYVTTQMRSHIKICTDMGYTFENTIATIKELLNRGMRQPTLDDILELIDVLIENQLQSNASGYANETPLEKNRRLKSYVICMNCQKNDINALLLPCGHHKLCMTCAAPLQNCPVCGRPIRYRIRTYRS